MSEPGTAKVEVSPRWQLARLAVLDELDMRAFQLLERLVVSLILREGFGRGRTKAYIPRLKLFEQFLSGARRRSGSGREKEGVVSRGCVCERLRDLKAARVIVEEPEFHYAVNPLFDEWTIARRPDAFAVRGTEALFDERREFPQLRDELREVFVESFARPAAPGNEGFRAGSAAVRSDGERRSADVRPAGEPGPESGSGGGLVDPRRVLAAAADREIERVAAATQGLKVRSSKLEVRSAGVPNSGTFQILERQAAGAAAKVSPIPPSKPVNSEQCSQQCSVVTGRKAAVGTGLARVSKAEGERILETVQEFLGADDLICDEEHRGWFWRAVAQRYPAALEEAARLGLYLARTQSLEIRKTRGHWLNAVTARTAGVRSLEGVKFGPWREES